MVAYSFNRVFAPQVAALTKLQTVRGHRRRHARPGEPIQLYRGMRTRQCVKLVDEDPIVISVTPIIIDVSDLIDEGIASIILGGQALNRTQIEVFAEADGFSPAHFGLWQGAVLGRASIRHATARSNMGDFWRATHGAARFEGVLIRWRPAG